MDFEALHPFHSEFITLAGDLAESFSFKRSIGQIYGFLYLCPDPISLEDIAKCCHMSKGNASVHLRTLEDWGAVHSSSKPGIRKDYYYANNDLTALALRRLQEGISKRLSTARHGLKTIKENPACSEHMKHPNGAHWAKRLEEIESLLKQVESGVSMLPKLAQMKTLLNL